jgi:hypothetical protein
MLDIVAAVFGTAYLAGQAVLLVAFLPVRTGVRAALFAGMAFWLTTVTGLYAAGGLPPHLLGPVPVNLLPFAVFTAFLFGGWLFLPGARGALAAVPLPALVGVHIGRIGGVLFLLAYADGRLSAPFAPIAGTGDFLTGVVALVIVAMLIYGKPPRRSWIAGWNAFGAADLLVAISLAVLSAPGANFRVFMAEPGTQILGTLPWVFVPAILVPVDLLTHALIAARLVAASREAKRGTAAFAV